MARVTGHIHVIEGKRGDVFYAKWRDLAGKQHQQRLGAFWDGKGRPRVGYLTRKMAEDALRDLLVDEGRGAIDRPDVNAVTFKEACDDWLRYVEHDKDRKPSTVSDYRNVVRCYLQPEFGEDTAVDTITQRHVERFRERLLEDGKLSRRTVQKVLVLLYAVFKRAERRGWIKGNPSEHVERIRLKASGDFNVLQPVEVDSVARAASDPQHAALFTVAAYTGLRMGELRALRWRDVDFAGRTVHVRRNFTKAAEGGPKSGKVRSVPMIDDALVALDALSRRDQLTEPEDLVFPGPTGYYFDDDTARDEFYAALRRAKLGHKRDGEDPIVFHDLRHTFGTLAVQAWPLTDVQAYMGHADVQTTMRYVHHVPKHDAAERLSAVVAAAKAPAEDCAAVLPR